MTIRLANAARSTFDPTGTARRIAEACDVDCLTFAYLPGDTAIQRETAARLAVDRQRDANLGDVPHFLEALRELTPALYLQPQLKVLSTAGAMNPLRCAERAAAILAEQGSGELTLAVVAGGDLLDRLEELMSQGCTLAHESTGEPLSALTPPIVAAYARAGAQGVADALKQGARVVITGMLASEALAIAAATEAHRWKWNDWDRLAAAAVAGCVLNSACLINADSHHAVPYDPDWPIAEITDGGEVLLRLGSEDQRPLDAVRVGKTLRRFTRERTPSRPSQLTTPDVAAALDALTIEPHDAGSVRLVGATGSSPESDLDAEVLYHAGYVASALFAQERPEGEVDISQMTDSVAARLHAAAGHSHAVAAELSLEQAAPGVVRIVAAHAREQPLRRFAAELARWGEIGWPGWIPLSPVPLAIEPRIETWPTRIPRDAVGMTVDCRSAQDWV